MSILATSAVRDAINADELRDAIRQAAPNAVEMEVLSGEQEAMLSAWGAVSAAGADVAYPVLDVGGASSELIYMGQGIESFSANVGAVRVVREGWSRSDVRDRLAAVYRKLRLSDKIIGVGGAITSAAGVIKGLGEYDRYAIEGTLLKKSQLEDLCAYYESMSIDQRCQSSPLMAQRGSIIVEGLWIWLSALDILDIDVVQVTGGGLLDGAVCKMAGLIPRYSCLE